MVGVFTPRESAVTTHQSAHAGSWFPSTPLAGFSKGCHGLCWDIRQWQIKDDRVRSQDLELAKRLGGSMHRGAVQERGQKTRSRNTIGCSEQYSELELGQTMEWDRASLISFCICKVKMDHFCHLVVTCWFIHSVNIYCLLYTKHGASLVAEVKASACNAGDPGLIPG